MMIEHTFLSSAHKRLSYYKELGDETFTQLTEADFHYQPNEVSNSIAIIIQHMAGNMLSRWTDFLTTDGEKEWRTRDAEFDEQQKTKQELIACWEQGWACCLDAIKNLKEDDLQKKITIRTESLTVIDAINRQLAHYPYHVGQIIFLGKLIAGDGWQNLSIKKGQSNHYNINVAQGAKKQP
jgi:hypothetical protein